MVIRVLLSVVAIGAIYAVARSLARSWRPVARRTVLAPEHDVSHVVTLVHGTFARGAGWTQAESELCQCLRQELGPGLALYALDWSGNNTVAARDAAGHGLRALLFDLLAEHPTAEHRLIAHSHGGNVALYALNDERYRRLAEQGAQASPKQGARRPEWAEATAEDLVRPLAERIHGVACLATPFLHARRRELGTQGNRLVLLAPLPWYLLAVVLLQRAGVPDLVGFFAALPVVLLIGWIAIRQARVERLVARLALDPRALRGRLFIARMGGDEAAAGLLSGQFAVALTTRLFVLLGRLVGGAGERHARRAAKLRRFGPFAAGVMVTGGATWALSAWRGASLVTDLGKIATLAGVLFLMYLMGSALSILLTYVFAALVLPVAVLLSLLLLIPFGPLIALSNLFLDVSVESTPPGEWTIHQFEPRARREESGKDGEEKADVPELRHSEVYRDSGVLAALGEWIERGAPEPGSQSDRLSCNADSAPGR